MTEPLNQLADHALSSEGPGATQPDAPQDASAERKHQRDSLFLMATCAMPSRHAEQRIKVRNLSASGLMAEGPLQPLVGEAVVLDLRNVGRVDGVVAWVRESRFGVAFAQEIDPAVVRQHGPAADPSPDQASLTYYQRGPVSVLARQAPSPDRLRPI